MQGPYNKWDTMHLEQSGESALPRKKADWDLTKILCQRIILTVYSFHGNNKSQAMHQGIYIVLHFARKQLHFGRYNSELVVG